MFFHGFHVANHTDGLSRWHSARRAHPARRPAFRYRAVAFVEEQRITRFMADRPG